MHFALNAEAIKPCVSGEGDDATARAGDVAGDSVAVLICELKLPGDFFPDESHSKTTAITVASNSVVASLYTLLNLAVFDFN
jgi:hypothetical protein